MLMDETIDKITIKDLNVKSRAGVDLWGKESQPQPIVINITFYAKPSADRSIGYEEFCNSVTDFAERQYKSMEILAEKLAEACVNEDGTEFRKFPGVHQVSVRIEKPRALLHAASVGVEVTRAAKGFNVTRDDMVFVRDLRVITILGVTPWEREQKQPVLLNLNVYYDNKRRPPLIRNIVKIISRHVEGCTYQAMESLAASVAKTAITECKLNKITVRLEKTGVLMFAKSAGVEITRTRDPSTGPRQIQETYHPRSNPDVIKITRDTLIPEGFDHLAFIIARSDNIDIIYGFLKSLEGTHDCSVSDTSFLYESINEGKFLHIACKIATSLSLEALQEKLKITNCELEVAFYDDDRISSLDNREFVLKPLCDIASEFDDPDVFSVCDPLLTQLLDNRNYDEQARKVIPIGKSKWCWKQATFAMGILDINKGVAHSVAHARALVEDQANIIDIGGVWDISEKEELERMIPIIKAIRENGINDILISINTHRATVAKEAIAAGANVINDYSGGTLDPNMYSVMAEKNVPVFLQHRREVESNAYADDDVVSGVCTELMGCVSNAIQAGVKTWNIIINPGLGCSKDTSQDHLILRRLSDIIGDNSPFEGFPCAVGVEDPAVCTVAILGGADILRVSDVKGMLKLIKVADDIYKSTPSPKKKSDID